MLMTKGLVKERKMTIMRRGGLGLKAFIFLFYLLLIVTFYHLSLNNYYSIIRKPLGTSMNAHFTF